MENAAAQQWFLRKHEDGSIFGPITFQQLSRWASSAQVAPHDSISSDQENWMKAPMLPDLGMDWIAEVTSERLYGPTTLGAIREFIQLGEIDDETFVINACNGMRQQIRDIAPLLATLTEEPPTPDAENERSLAAPATTGMSIAVQERISELEEALRDERRALAAAEKRYADLEAKGLQSTSEPAA